MVGVQQTNQAHRPAVAERAGQDGQEQDRVDQFVRGVAALHRVMYAVTPGLVPDSGPASAADGR